MAQIDAHLSRLFRESNFSFQDDIWDLYDFAPNEDLRRILAAYHTGLNNWFSILNNDIRMSYDDDGNVIYEGGYFHAQDSRDYLAFIDSLDQLKSKLSATVYAFQLVNETYAQTIRKTRQFVVKSGGSTIPADFARIEIEELTPIFQMAKSTAIVQDRKTLYANLKPIGTGSYASVYRYEDPTYHIPIALKRAKSSLTAKELERFKREFEVLHGLHSPYIIDVYAYNPAANEYSMEFLDETIYDFIRRNNTKLSLTKRKGLISQICRGLRYLHEKGMLHRDISLSNVFVKHYEDVDVVKIGDFGLVKIPESNLTSILSDKKGSLNDPDLINVGFENYEMCHETFALTWLCFYILTGKQNYDRQKEGTIKQFWEKGTNPNKAKRFASVDELWNAVQAITVENA